MTTTRACWTARLCAAVPFVLLMLVTTRARARGCTEVSDIVGEQHCTRFGGIWSIEHRLPIMFRFGMRYNEVSTSNTNFTEQIGKNAKRPSGYQPYSYPGEALGVRSLSALGADGGFGFFLYGQLYLSFEGSFALGTASTASFTTASGVKLSSDDGLNVMMFQGGIPLGYRIPLGRAALRGEVMTGLLETTVGHRVEATGLPSTGSASQTRVLIEPRIAADIWFTQHISFGVYGGMNLLDTDGHGRAFGISLVWHNRSFDGDTSF